MRFGSVRGLRVQLLLWTVLPLTFMLVAVAVWGINIHETAMRELVAKMDARAARLAAGHLSDQLSNRLVVLDSLIDGATSAGDGTLDALFDGGIAFFAADGTLKEAFPPTQNWDARPVNKMQAGQSVLSMSHARQALYSPLFIDPASGNEMLLVGLAEEDGQMVMGAVSLARLGEPGVLQLTNTPSEVPRNNGSQSLNVLISFLVDPQGTVIYHPDPTQIGLDYRPHEGVIAVTQGLSGATFHREENGQEMVAGYAPVAGPGWGLVVQEPWETLIAPNLRLSLLTPLVVVIAALISGAAVTFGLRNIVYPLQALDKQATAVAWGDFSAVDKPVGGVQEIDDLRRTLEGMTRQIQRYQTGMRDYIAAVTAAQEDERRRLARELHDETIQSLIALGHRVEMAQKALDKNPERARERLEQLRTMVLDTQTELRRFVRALRPLYLEDLGLVTALEMLAKEVSAANGLDVTVRIQETPRRLSPDIELTAYRIAQEGLSNVVRHAQAQSAVLTVTFAQKGVHLWLKDDGVGFNPPVNPADMANEGHFGLMGIHERALLFGGWLTIHAQPGEGSELEIFLPAAKE